MQGATSTMPDGLPISHAGENGQRELPVVFSQRNVRLSEDLPINARLRKIFCDLIRNGGGDVVDSVDKCDMFICQFRDGQEYIEAAQSGKDVGNLAWLYHLIVHNEWTSPFRRLLHYPVPRNGIPGFENMKITLSNYGGEARIYLENLITATGATFTKTMKADNTHLITARMNSEKCDAARDWNIQTINHLWIEESYAKCEVQPLTVPKYTHFPSRTNLGEVIGQTFFDETKLHELYYPGNDENQDGAAKRRRKVLDAAQENLLAVGQNPTAGKKRGAAKNFDVRKDESMEDSTATPRAGRAQRGSNARTVSTPAQGRHVRAGKENDTPSVMSSGSRSAKAQALSKLQDISVDIALYEKEKKRKAKDGPWGGKRAADQIDKERGGRSSSPVHEQPEEEDEEQIKRPAKKQKPSVPPADMRIVLTGYKRWVNDRNKEDPDRVCFGPRPPPLLELFPCDQFSLTLINNSASSACSASR